MRAIAPVARRVGRGHAASALLVRALALLACLGRSEPVGAVVIGEESRRVPTQEERAFYAATGALDCGGVRSTAQLTVSPAVITTVAHGFYGRDGRPIVPLGRCTFHVGGRSYGIDAASVVVGSARPYRVAGTSDWAAARLTTPARDIEPYRLAEPSGQVTLLAQSHADWRHGLMAIETCQARERRLEIKIDCDTGQGASGAGLLVPGTRTIFGVFVGFRSAHADRAAPFDARSHHNYGVAIQGSFRRAVERLAY